MLGFDYSSAIRLIKAVQSQTTRGRQLSFHWLTGNAYRKLSIRFVGTVLYLARLWDLSEKAVSNFTPCHHLAQH